MFGLLVLVLVIVRPFEVVGRLVLGVRPLDVLGRLVLGVRPFDVLGRVIPFEVVGRVITLEMLGGERLSVFGVLGRLLVVVILLLLLLPFVFVRLCLWSSLLFERRRRGCVCVTSPVGGLETVRMLTSPVEELDTVRVWLGLVFGVGGSSS